MIFIILLYLLIDTLPTPQCVVYVNTKLGPIKGLTMLSRNGHKFDAFLGIPYARPPIGELRFQAPIQNTSPWNGTLDATKYSPLCVQKLAGEIIGQEDCLYLNLYRQQQLDNTNSLLPVWVFIYGGKKQFGDAAPYKYGPHYIMDKPVILITMSYRMGVLGYLSTADNAITGNFGLKDQTAVLIWIQAHITRFGGDPTNVTLSGGSSGAIDVNLHMHSPLSKGLFHRAICQSGQSLNSEVIQDAESARRRAWQLAAIAGCNSSRIRTSEMLVKCLRKIPVRKLVASSLRLQHDFILPFITFGSVIESKHTANAFVVSDPCDDIHASSSVPWMLGGIPDEGSQRSLTLFSKTKIVNHFEKYQNELLPQYFRFSNHPNAKQVFQRIKQKYLKDKPVRDSFREIAKIYGFSNFHLGTIESALHYKGPLYLYCYDYDNYHAYLKTYLLMLSQLTKHKIGAVHGEELTSLFSNVLLYPLIMDGPDRVVSDQVVDLWFNFVAYGNPNGKDSKTQVWKPVQSSNLEYLHINNLSLTMRQHYFMEDDYVFWKRIGSPTLCNRIANEHSQL